MQPQWVNVKLTREDDFNEIWLYPKYGGEAVDGFPIDFKLMVSLDGAEWTEVVSKTDYPVPAYTLIRHSRKCLVSKQCMPDMLRLLLRSYFQHLICGRGGRQFI